MTDQQQGARMLTLGERLVLAARLAAAEHLHQSVSAALCSDSPATRIAIGGAGPVPAHRIPHLANAPELLAQRLRQAGRRAEAA